MNKVHKIICVGILLCVSCQNALHTTEIKQVEGGDSKEESFNSFFLRFRNNVQDADVEGIKELTLFPLKTRGDFDGMPYRYVTSNDFGDFYKCFSREFGGGKYINSLKNPLLEDTNVYELLHADLTKDFGGSLNGNEYYLGNWEFEKINGRWYFAFAYTNYFERNYNR